MLNKEKFQKQLEDFLVKKIAVYRDYEEAIEQCGSFPCNKCLFFQNGKCGGFEAAREWLNSEYVGELTAEDMFKALGYERKETDAEIEYFQPDKEENYIIFRKDANQMSVGAYALSKDEFKACSKQMEELGANK